jgi:hypothetical protein
MDPNQFQSLVEICPEVYFQIMTNLIWAWTNKNVQTEFNAACDSKLFKSIPIAGDLIQRLHAHEVTVTLPFRCMKTAATQCLLFNVHDASALQIVFRKY